LKGAKGEATLRDRDARQQQAISVPPAAVDVGGEKRAFDIEGKREKKDK
jgi:hypothetical protein